jgi:hypothetical protein
MAKIYTKKELNNLSIEELQQIDNDLSGGSNNQPRVDVTLSSSSLEPDVFQPMTSVDCKLACGDRDPDGHQHQERAKGGVMSPNIAGPSCYEACMECTADPDCHWYEPSRPSACTNSWTDEHYGLWNASGVNSSNCTFVNGGEWCYGCYDDEGYSACSKANIISGCAPWWVFGCGSVSWEDCDLGADPPDPPDNECSLENGLILGNDGTCFAVCSDNLPVNRGQKSRGTCEDGSLDCGACCQSTVQCWMYMGIGTPGDAPYVDNPGCMDICTQGDNKDGQGNDTDACNYQPPLIFDGPKDNCRHTGNMSTTLHPWINPMDAKCGSWNNLGASFSACCLDGSTPFGGPGNSCDAEPQNTPLDCAPECTYWACDTDGSLGATPGDCVEDVWGGTNYCNDPGACYGECDPAEVCTYYTCDDHGQPAGDCIADVWGGTDYCDNFGLCSEECDPPIVYWQCDENTGNCVEGGSSWGDDEGGCYAACNTLCTTACGDYVETTGCWDSDCAGGCDDLVLDECGECGGGGAAYNCVTNGYCSPAALQCDSSTCVSAAYDCTISFCGPSALQCDASTCNSAAYNCVTNGYCSPAALQCDNTTCVDAAYDCTISFCGPDALQCGAGTCNSAAHDCGDACGGTVCAAADCDATHNWGCNCDGDAAAYDCGAACGGTQCVVGDCDATWSYGCNCDGDAAAYDCGAACGGTQCVVGDCDATWSYGCDCDGTPPEINYDCDGNCTAVIDCAGVCGGGATEDDCGICGGDNSSCTIFYNPTADFLVYAGDYCYDCVDGCTGCNDAGLFDCSCWGQACPNVSGASCDMYACPWGLFDEHSADISYKQIYVGDLHLGDPTTEPGTSAGFKTKHAYCIAKGYDLVIDYGWTYDTSQPMFCNWIIQDCDAACERVPDRCCTLNESTNDWNNDCCNYGGPYACAQSSAYASNITELGVNGGCPAAGTRTMWHDFMPPADQDYAYATSYIKCGYTRSASATGDTLISSKLVTGPMYWPDTQLVDWMESLGFSGPDWGGDEIYEHMSIYTSRYKLSSVGRLQKGGQLGKQSCPPGFSVDINGSCLQDN